MSDIQSSREKKRRLFINVAHIGENGLTLSGELPAKIFDIGNSERLSCTRPLTYDININIVSTAVLVTGKVGAVFSCKCDKCLMDYLQPLNNENVCHYIEVPPDRQLDLTEEIREDILILFPQKFLCMPNCAGLCSSCGENLNIRKCRCGHSEQTFAVWSGLDKLRI